MTYSRLNRKPSSDSIFSSFTEPHHKNPIRLVSAFSRDEFYHHITEKPSPSHGITTAYLHASSLATMSDYAFAYYFPAFFDYLMSDHSSGDGCTFLSIHSTISFRHGTMKSHFPHCREEVIACLRYCADHIQKFDVNRVINSLHTGRNYEPPLEHIIRELLAEVSGDVSPAADSNRLPSEIPTLIDISPSSCLDLDERTAVENFLGKTFDEAKAMFFDHAERYTEDLGWMGRAAFNFYFPAYAAYLKSNSACPDDFMWLITPIFIQGNPDFHELRNNADVLDIIDYGIELLSRPENGQDSFFHDILKDLIKMKNQIVGKRAER